MAPESRYKNKYLQEIRKRAGKSRIYRKYQLIGLEIAKTLEDEKHKVLYIKLAKQGNCDLLLRTAKEIAERSAVRNKGAYFMSVIYASGNNAKQQKNK